MSAAGERCGAAPGGGHAPGCVTCSDAATWMRVVEVDAAGDLARCVDADGRSETVAIELVGAVLAGEAVLVHAGIALHRDAGTAGGPAEEAG